MEWAFHGPATLRQRLGHLDAAAHRRDDRGGVVAVCCAKPAIHRFPAVDGPAHPRPVRRCVDDYDGGRRAGLGWRADGRRALPPAARAARLRRREGAIFIAILGKRMGVRPDGWRDAAGKFGDDVPRSVADSTSPEALAAVRQLEARPEGRQARQAGPPPDPVARQSRFHRDLGADQHRNLCGNRWGWGVRAWRRSTRSCAPRSRTPRRRRGRRAGRRRDHASGRRPRAPCA